MHLGLFLTEVEYISVNTIPCIKSLHPGNLHVPVGPFNHKATCLIEYYIESIRLFRGAIDVKKVFVK